MAEFTLVQEPVLGKYTQSFAGSELAEAWQLAIVSLAVPLGGEAAVNAALTKAYGTTLPQAAGSSLSEDGGTRILSLSPDQFFVIFEPDKADAADLVAARLGAVAYYTLQSDNWACLRLSGPQAIKALERICPIDLQSEEFPLGSVHRTVMEHLGTIIVKEKPETFLLLSAASSAQSFLDAIETSIKNVA